MKRLPLVVFLLMFTLAALPADDGWRAESDRADRYYFAGDYDAAWLFYERALKAGADDGLIVFRAAESFRRQTLTVDPAFGPVLFAVAHHYIQEQYPEDPALGIAGSRMPAGIVVDRRFLRKTYGIIGAKAPRSRRPVSDGLGAVAGFIGARVETLSQLLMVLRTEGLRPGLSWAWGHIGGILLSILVLNALTGIILPVVMAVTVAREGRKSYVTAYAFLFHWGPLGIHRFYLGRYVSGIIWLLTGGLLGIGLFFDIFLTGAYVRFWNEDHRNERPGLRSTAVRTMRPERERPPKRIRPPKMKRVREKPVKVKPEKVKKARPEKPQRPARPDRERNRPGRGGPVADDDMESGMTGSAAITGDGGGMTDMDGGFEDLPDLDFDTDFSKSADSGDMTMPAELSDDLSEDDFDIKSLE